MEDKFRDPQRNCDSCASAAAQMYCCCTSPPTYLCGTCGIDHTDSRPPHKVLPLVVTNEGAGWTRCSLCNLSKSALLCCCVLPPVPLCNTCVKSHDRTSDPPHVHVSILARTYLTSTENVEKLVEKHVGKEEAKSRLIANIERITVAEREVHGECEKLVSVVRKKEAEICAKLGQIKEELNLMIGEAVKEAEDHLHEENYECSGLTAAILNYHKMSNKPDLHLFSCSLSTQRTEEALEQFISLSYDQLALGSPNAANFIPVLTPKMLRKYDYEHETWLAPVALSKGIEVSTQSSWLFIDNGKWVFVCGRYPSSASAYLIDSVSGAVEQQQNMRVRRCEHGMAVFQNNVYVFGGLDSPKYLKSCEKFSLTSRAWAPLPDMLEARDCFNPCVYKGEAYLIGGRNARSSEIFHIATETFRKLKIALPRADMTSCILIRTTLVAMQSDGAYEWDMDSPSPSIRKAKFAWGESWSNFPPVHFEGTIFILSFAKSIKKTDLHTYTNVPVPPH